jgi:2TM family of unknown function (DUF5676)
MKCDPRALVRATVSVMTLSYIVCFVFVALAPGAAMTFFGQVLHTDLSTLPVTITIGSFVAGLLFWSGLTAIAAWLTAWFYNRAVGA